MNIRNFTVKESARGKNKAMKHFRQIQKKVTKHMLKGEEPLVLTLNGALRLNKKGVPQSIWCKQLYRKSKAYRESYEKTIHQCMGSSGRLTGVWEFTSKMPQGRQAVKI